MKTDNRECVWRVDKSNCLILNWKNCNRCKFFKSNVFINENIKKRKATYKKEKKEQLLKSKGGK